MCLSSNKTLQALEIIPSPSMATYMATNGIEKGNEYTHA